MNQCALVFVWLIACAGLVAPAVSRADSNIVNPVAAQKVSAGKVSTGKVSTGKVSSEPFHSENALTNRTSAAGRIPRAALTYRAELIRSARVVWGLDAPVAVFAAQVHTESWWRNDTVSQAGAQGLAQFLPSTAAWLPEVAPELTRAVGQPAPFNPGWALRALVTYDLWLYQRVTGATACDHMAFTLSAYNGGLGWVRKDKRLAQTRGLLADRWFGHTEAVNAGRRSSSYRENRKYVQLILHERQEFYRLAGWGQGVRCE